MSDDNDPLSTVMNELHSQMTALRQQLTDTEAKLSALKAAYSSGVSLPPTPSLAAAPVPYPSSDPDRLIPSAATSLGRRDLLKRLGKGVTAVGLAAASMPLLTASAQNELPTHPQSIARVGPQVGGPLTLTETFVGYGFKPIDSATTYFFEINPYGGIHWLGGGSNYFYHRLELPQGAKVTKLTFYFTDIDPAKDITFYLESYDPTVGTVPFITLTSSGSTPGIRSVQQTGTPTIPLMVIDNTVYTYNLAFSPSVGGISHILWGAKLEYVNIRGQFGVA